MNLLVLVKRNATGLSFLALTWLVFFSPVLFGGHVYFLDDLKIIYYPIEHAYAEFQADWSLPTWSPLFGFGQPLLAWGQLGFFTPVHLILRFLGLHPLILLQVSIVTYFALGLLGMFLFLRRRRLGQLPAALGAIIFTFSGFQVGHLNHINFYVATMVLPWLLLAIDAFLSKPTLARTAVLAVVAAIVPLSGQPQISLYTLLIAATYGLVTLLVNFYHDITRRASGRIKEGLWVYLQSHLLKLTLGITVAGILSIGLASFAILPLLEFLPETERLDALPEEELFEFSYPPQHVITLVFPYFFGNHEEYWGAKSFQELAAYTGIIPLLLAGVSLTNWKTRKTERLFGLLLITVSLIMALGIYSPIYRYLVESKTLDQLTVPGRFVYFFDVAIAILAATSLEQLMQKAKHTLWQRILPPATSLIIVGGLFVPFAYQATKMPSLLEQLYTILQPSKPVAWLTFTSLLFFLATYLLPGTASVKKTLPALLVLTSALTLVFFGWNYNPLIPAGQALTPSPFEEELKQYQSQTGLPPRIYSRSNIYQQAPPNQLRPTEDIAPSFWIAQPVPDLPPVNPCLLLPIQNNRTSRQPVAASLHLDPLAPPISQTLIEPDHINNNRPQQICFPEILQHSSQAYWLTLTAQQQTSINFYTVGETDQKQSAYIVRVTNPNQAQWQRSSKPLKLLTEQSNNIIDTDTTLLDRHLNVTSGSSSGRWIGALSIQPYRRFIEKFLANDNDQPIDGDGLHFILRDRNIFNMTGITHLAQAIKEPSHDLLPSLGLKIEDKFKINENTTARLYRNPEVFPKAFLVENAVWQPAADEIRAEMLNPQFDPATRVYLSGPKPPEEFIERREIMEFAQLSDQVFRDSQANITRYEHARVDVKVAASKPAWLVLTDSTTPQWQTYIDDQPAPQYIANSVFKAAEVPPGQHVISFRYESPAVELSKKLTLAGLAVTGTLFAMPLIQERLRKRQEKKE